MHALVSQLQKRLRRGSEPHDFSATRGAEEPKGPQRLSTAFPMIRGHASVGAARHEVVCSAIKTYRALQERGRMY